MDLSHFQPILKNKYLVILLLLAILAILLPSYIKGYELWVAYIITGFTALITFGLYHNIRFQRLHHIFRPFIVVRILQVVITIASLAAFTLTLVDFSDMVSESSYIPYGIFWLLLLALSYQFYDIFHLAKKAKKDFPDRCEFC